MSKLFGSRLCGNRGRIFTIDICLTSFHFYLFPNIQVAGLSLIEGILKSTDGINDFIKTRHCAQGIKTISCLFPAGSGFGRIAAVKPECAAIDDDVDVL